ncbi:hypothetical protein ACFLRB_02590 [Acidobacteriota bacterium]
MSFGDARFFFGMAVPRFGGFRNFSQSFRKFINNRAAFGTIQQTDTVDNACHGQNRE